MAKKFYVISSRSRSLEFKNNILKSVENQKYDILQGASAQNVTNSFKKDFPYNFINLVSKGFATKTEANKHIQKLIQKYNDDNPKRLGI